ncbi:hypothetical protein K3152_10680 [Qipengyuania sp. 1NDH17]|uniref:Uncharacterized protein n=1 Tax=Qipengyuania polymorpha TaxID=2867234 RepID=A0ABS7J2Z9_9SPHN|nr:hypothetical protein [Qipengyuania polymorpha]MBX7458710.1 hypothetical protein [Qipengyuania polymorpha]
MSSNRRAILAGIAAGASLSLLSLPVRLAAAPRGITFPEGRFILRRELERGLGGGAAIVVTRNWECSFDQIGAGASVRGTQGRCDVKAPPALAALAEMERSRKVTGLFPMKLDNEGHIFDWGGRGATGIEAALRAADARIDSLTLADGDKRDAKAWLAQVGSTAAEVVSQVPRDLFFPEAGKRTENRKMALPDGQTGSYDITIEAEARQSDGLLVSSERRIVTRIGDSSRIARERWTLLA